MIKNTTYELRYATNPSDFKSYDTARIRQDFLIPNLFINDELRMVYTMYDRYIAGGAMPVSDSLLLESIEPLKAPYFLARRELGIINVGGKGCVCVDGTSYELDYQEALYVGQGNKEVIFSSASAEEPARFYFNSAPAHTSYPTKHITKAEANVIHAGSMEGANKRTIRQLIVNQIVPCCQLQMGITQLEPGSVWNTMPAHTHDRRMEIYLYLEVPPEQAVCHFMGTKEETRHIWLQNLQAVISPEWSIHSGCATSNYTFIWGMCGENLDYGDMDTILTTELK